MFCYQGKIVIKGHFVLIIGEDGNAKKKKSTICQRLALQ